MRFGQGDWVIFVLTLYADVHFSSERLENNNRVYMWEDVFQNLHTYIRNENLNLVQ